jgi:hypothetical protein
LFRIDFFEGNILCLGQLSELGELIRKEHLLQRKVKEYSASKTESVYDTNELRFENQEDRTLVLRAWPNNLSTIYDECCDENEVCCF